MKAVQINAYGGNDILELNADAPKPSISKDEILVEVHAASLNPFDKTIRSGYMKDIKPLNFPITLGGDFSGIVVEAGENVTHLKTGDEVYGQSIIMRDGSGSFAEFAAVNESNSALKPKNLSHTESAALPLVGASALQALEDSIKLKAGQKILIHGGAGGIGSVAIQLAKSLGAFVSTTVRADDKNYVKDLGADQVIDYQKDPYEEVLKDFDAVLDTIGGETTIKSFRVLKRGGILVAMIGNPSQELADKYGVRLIKQFTQTNTGHLNRLRELVESGQIKPQVNKVFSLEQVQEAFRYMEQGHGRGKVVLNVE